jgi:DNA topoisomerase I
MKGKGMEGRGKIAGDDPHSALRTPRSRAEAEVRQYCSMKKMEGAGIEANLEIDPRLSAQTAGLRYVSDASPGISRIKCGQGFSYRAPSGKPLRDPGQLRRIRSLAIPPAWTEVWICPLAHGHLQATGRDARGRKQHRYHPRWRETRDEAKYNRMISFAQALPKIRRRIEKDLRLKGTPREKVLATVARLLELTLIRVGNEEYARENKSYGLTTMKDRHAEIGAESIHFQFRGKRGIQHLVSIKDRRLARIIKQCQDLPGQELFQYQDEEGQLRDVTSDDVNQYLREISGHDFTAKDFRTWAGTLLAAVALREFEKFDTQAQARKNILRAIETVAKRLGNTPAICRKCYIHPEVMSAYLDGATIKTIQQRAETQMKSALRALTPEEAAVVGMLQQRLAQRKEPLEALLDRSIKKIKQQKRRTVRRAAHR